MTIKEGVMASAPQLALYLTPVSEFQRRKFYFLFLSLQLLIIFGKDQRPNLVKC